MIKWLIAIMILLMVIAIIILSMIMDCAVDIRTYVKSINLLVVPKDVPPTPPTSGSVAHKTKEAVIERLAEIFDSIRYGTEATIVIHWSSSEIPTINYDIEEAVVKRSAK